MEYNFTYISSLHLSPKGYAEVHITPGVDQSQLTAPVHEHDTYTSTIQLNHIGKIILLRKRRSEQIYNNLKIEFSAMHMS
uniref:SFRICE_015807 n=1 Tax=Spodoptera frugiperda TaxID=7108 RepID=A0A2H1VDH1_SPOFR